MIVVDYLLHAPVERLFMPSVSFVFILWTTLQRSYLLLSTTLVFTSSNLHMYHIKTLLSTFSKKAD